MLQNNCLLTFLGVSLYTQHWHWECSKWQWGQINCWSEQCYVLFLRNGSCMDTKSTSPEQDRKPHSELCKRGIRFLNLFLVTKNSDLFFIVPFCHYCSYVRNCLILWENQLLTATTWPRCLLFLSLLVTKHLTWLLSRYDWFSPILQYIFTIVAISYFGIHSMQLKLTILFFKKQHWKHIRPSMA